MSKRLIDVGYLKVGMILQDGKGNKGTITRLAGFDEMSLVEIDNNPNPVMWDWDRINPDVLVLEESE